MAEPEQWPEGYEDFELVWSGTLVRDPASGETRAYMDVGTSTPMWMGQDGRWQIGTGPDDTTDYGVPGV